MPHLDFIIVTVMRFT